LPVRYSSFEKRDTRKWAKENKAMSYQAEQQALKKNIDAVCFNIKGFNARKVYASVVLSQYYSAKAIQLFRKFQAFNAFWTNRTETAYNTVFGALIDTQTEVGFLIAHKVEYGVYLELANDRKHESLVPIIIDLDAEFQKDLREIWGDAA